MTLGGGGGGPLVPGVEEWAAAIFRKRAMVRLSRIEGAGVWYRVDVDGLPSGWAAGMGLLLKERVREERRE